MKRAENWKRYEAALQKLGAAEREAIVLRLELQYDYAEIAVILDCDEGTARVRFQRAKTLLRHHLRAGADQRGLK